MQPFVMKLNKLLIAVLVTATLFSCNKDTAAPGGGTREAFHPVRISRRETPSVRPDARRAAGG